MGGKGGRNQKINQDNPKPNWKDSSKKTCNIISPRIYKIEIV